MKDKNDIFIDVNEIINNTIEGILIIEEGFIKDMNKSLLEILGYENKDELLLPQQNTIKIKLHN